MEIMKGMSMRISKGNIVLAVALLVLMVLLLVPGKGFGGAYEVAQGLEDPPVIEPAPRPARLGWAGPYAGVMTVAVRDNIRIFDCDGNLDWTGGTVPGERWSRTSMENGRYGYLEGQLGLDAGRLLPYVSAGAMRLHGETGGMIGVGADMRIGKSARWLVGAKVQRMVGSDYKATAATIRFGVGF